MSPLYAYDPWLKCIYLGIHLVEDGDLRSEECVMHSIDVGSVLQLDLLSRIRELYDIDLPCSFRFAVDVLQFSSDLFDGDLTRRSLEDESVSGVVEQHRDTQSLSGRGWCC